MQSILGYYILPSFREFVPEFIQTELITRKALDTSCIYNPPTSHVVSCFIWFVHKTLTYLIVRLSIKSSENSNICTRWQFIAMSWFMITGSTSISYSRSFEYFLNIDIWKHRCTPDIDFGNYNWCELIRSFTWESSSWCKPLADEALQPAICDHFGLCTPLAQSIFSSRRFNLWILDWYWGFRSVWRIVITCYGIIWRYKFINKNGKYRKHGWNRLIKETKRYHYQHILILIEYEF